MAFRQVALLSQSLTIPRESLHDCDQLYDKSRNPIQDFDQNMGHLYLSRNRFRDFFFGPGVSREDGRGYCEENTGSSTKLFSEQGPVPCCHQGSGAV
jgi:hypothetical protein